MISSTGLPLIRNPSSQKVPVSVSRERFHCSPAADVARALFVATTPKSMGRLFNGTGRTKAEADLLVQSGNELFGQKELENALVKFTAAIADKDKQKAKDFPHAEAYLGAAAIFDHQGKKTMALDHFHKGSVLLHRIQPHSFLLAGSYFRIALLHKERGSYYYHQAIDFLKKALEIYKLKIEHKEYVAIIHKELSELYTKIEQPKQSGYHSRINLEMEGGPVRLQKKEGFLQEFFTKEKGELSSRSSIATEPSPIPFRGKSLPPLAFQDAANSPARFGVIHQMVGTSVHREDKECSPLPVMRERALVQHQDKECSPFPMHERVSVQHQGCSPFKILPQIIQPAPIQNPAPPKVSTGVAQLIHRTSVYGSSKPEKVTAVQELWEKLDAYAKGQPKDPILEYVNRELAIPGNPIFAGRRTRNVEEMFREAKHRLEG